MGSIGLAAVILFVFLYIVRTSVQAQERGEELTQRTRELASLQMGLLSTVLQTLVDARRDDRPPLGRRRPLLP